MWTAGKSDRLTKRSHESSFSIQRQQRPDSASRWLSSLTLLGIYDLYLVDDSGRIPATSTRGPTSAHGVPRCTGTADLRGKAASFLAGVKTGVPCVSKAQSNNLMSDSGEQEQLELPSESGFSPVPYPASALPRNG